MSINKVFAAAFAVALFLSITMFSGCTDNVGGVAYPSVSNASKIINTESASAEGTLLVEFAGLAPETSLPEGVAAERLFPGAADELGRWYIVRFPEDMPAGEMAGLLAERSDVTRIQYDKLLHSEPFGVTMHEPSAGIVTKDNAAVFDDPMLPEQWHMVNDGSRTHCTSAVEGADVAVKDAWKLTGGDPSIIVAVLDYGVMYTHPDLAPNMWVNEAELNGQEGVDDDGNGYVDDIYGYNFASNGPVTWDKDGDHAHGTHVAGTVAAVNNNGVGVCGVAGGTGSGDGIRMMTCQIFSKTSSSAGMARAFKYAADNGASVAQCSFGYDAEVFADEEEYRSKCAVEYAAIQYFLDKSHNNSDVLDGNIIIVSAGNNGKPVSGFPGGMKDVVCVTAFGPGFQPAGYSNYGAGCNISAPGGDFYIGRPGHNTYCQVLSTVPEANGEPGYGWLEGTSMSTPHVSGVAALGLSYARKLGKKFSREEFVSMLLTSVNDIDRYFVGTKPLAATGTMNLADYVGKMGTGAVDAWKLLMQVEGTKSFQVPVGRHSFDVAAAAGDPAHVMKNWHVEMDEASRASLGITGDLAVSDGKITLECTKVGSGKMTVTADSEGLEVSKVISVICRPVAASNGGWL